jgi:hypothetical protein
MAAAEPKPSLVGRLFAEHRAALQSFFSAAHPQQGRCGGSNCRSLVMTPAPDQALIQEALKWK